MVALTLLLLNRSNSINLLSNKSATLFSGQNLNEDMIIAVVIAIEGIANKPENKFVTPTGFERMASTLALQCFNMVA